MSVLFRSSQVSTYRTFNERLRLENTDRQMTPASYQEMMQHGWVSGGGGGQLIYALVQYKGSPSLVDIRWHVLLDFTAEWAADGGRVVGDAGHAGRDDPLTAFAGDDKGEAGGSAVEGQGWSVAQGRKKSETDAPYSWD